MSNARNLARLLPNTSGQLPDANLAAIAAGKVAGKLAGGNMASGSVLQVVQTVKYDSWSYNGASFVDITGLNASVTPLSSTSKILVDVCVSIGEGGDAFPAFYLQRDGATLVLGPSIPPGTRTSFAHVNTGADARDQYLIAPVNFKYLDSPSTTNSVNYKIQVSPMRTASRSVFVNRSESMSDANQVTATSTITLTEIAG